MDNIIVPNFNPNLAVLRVWNSKREGLGDVAEYPVIAWRLVENCAPIPISTDGEHADDEVSDFMVYDRATKTGMYQGGNIHSREACVEELHDTLDRRQRAEVRK